MYHNKTETPFNTLPVGKTENVNCRHLQNKFGISRMSMTAGLILKQLRFFMVLSL